MSSDTNAAASDTVSSDQDGSCSIPCLCPFLVRAGTRTDKRYWSTRLVSCLLSLSLSWQGSRETLKLRTPDPCPVPCVCPCLVLVLTGIWTDKRFWDTWLESCPLSLSLFWPYPAAGRSDRIIRDTGRVSYVPVSLWCTCAEWDRHMDLGQPTCCQDHFLLPFISTSTKELTANIFTWSHKILEQKTSLITPPSVADLISSPLCIFRVHRKCWNCNCRNSASSLDRLPAEWCIYSLVVKYKTLNVFVVKYKNRKVFVVSNNVMLCCNCWHFPNKKCELLRTALVFQLASFEWRLHQSCNRADLAFFAPSRLLRSLASYLPRFFLLP